MKYKYEFKMSEDFELGDCEECPLHYEECVDDEYGDFTWYIHCPISGFNSECPLVEVKE